MLWSNSMKKIQEYALRIGVKSFLRKPSIFGILMLFFCFVIYALEQEKISKVPANSLLSEIESNSVRVVDGDTVVIDNIKIRLQGIDAPELNQKCKFYQTNELYACGEGAKNFLITLIDNHTVKCLRKGIDRYGRVLAYCFVGDLNLNKEMIRSGNAVAYRKYDDSFVIDEIFAKKEKKGIWSSAFDEPEKWRMKKNCKIH